MAVPDWLSGLGSGIYNWASGNPMEALTLGVGAAGTGMGIYNQMQQANQFDKAQKDYMRAVQERQRLAESFSQMGPRAFMPKLSPEHLQASYFRPAATFMAERGQSDGGAFRGALADAAVKAEMDRYQMGNNIYQSRLGALGYGPPPGPRQTMPASGTTGALGSALQNIMMMRAMRARQQQTPPGAAWGSGVGADQGFYSSPDYGMVPGAAGGPSGIGYGLQYSGDMSVPNYQLSGSFRMPAGPGDQRYTLRDFSPNDSSMNEALTNWTAMPDYSGSY